MTQLEIIACLADGERYGFESDEWLRRWETAILIDWYSSRSPEYSILTHLAREAAESLKP